MNRKPTPGQVESLEAVDAGDAITTPVLRNLMNRGWVAIGAADRPELTAEGHEAMEDGVVERDYLAIPQDELPPVRVERRTLGRSPIRGGRSVPAGRNVSCTLCYRARKAAHEAGETRVSPDPVVWFTNESGSAAERAAELAKMRHALKHYRTEGEA